MANDNSQEKKVFVENVSKINFGISENQKNSDLYVVICQFIRHLETQYK